MKMVLSFLFLVVMTFTSAHAGFRGYNQGRDLKLFNELDCSTGVECTKVRNKFTVATTGLGQLRARSLASARVLTQAECGSTIYNSGAIEIDLPDANTVIGCRYTFVVLNAANFDIDPDAADQILVWTDAAGDRIRNATLGNTVVLEAVSASQWAVVGHLGTWSDAN